MEGLVTLGKLVGSGLATIGVVGAGIGIGIIFCGVILATSRNPENVGTYERYMWLGFALTEAMGLLAIMMAMLILFGV